jgi:hypothetical protein
VHAIAVKAEVVLLSTAARKSLNSSLDFGDPDNVTLADGRVWANNQKVFVGRPMTKLAMTLRLTYFR